MAFRCYLKISFNQKEAAKQFCRSHNLYSILWDSDRKMWYYPQQLPPESLIKKYPVLEVVECEEGSAPKVEEKSSPLNEEQLLINETEPSGPENSMGVIAFAGCGKTFTLKAYAKKRPDKRFLYVAFGNAIAKSAGSEFPPNTVCSTLHALARNWLIDLWGAEVVKTKIVMDFKADVICSALGLESNRINLATGVMIRHVLENYLTSTDITIQRKHVTVASEAGGTSWSLSDEIQVLLKQVERLWNRMKDPKDNVGITHDGYLKMYALSRPVWPFDYILLDEAQDTNPVTEELVFMQKCKKIMVGDPHQNIYTFRKARDILTRRRNDQTPYRYLTTSYRFPQQIADAANIILSIFKDEKHPLIGRGKYDAKIWGPGTTASWELNQKGTFEKFTLLGRTNGVLFDEALKICNIIEAYEKTTGKEGPKIAFVGTTAMDRFDPFKPYKWGRFLDITYLANGEREKIFDPFVKKFTTLKDLSLLVTAEATFDAELSAAITLYERYRGSLPAQVYKIRSRCADPKSPNVWVTFASAHKSKGLEWANVRLANDFIPLTIKDRVAALKLGFKDETGIRYPRLTNLRDFTPDEYNLFYVAITRAMANLEISEGFADLLVYLRKQSMVHNWDNYLTLKVSGKIPPHLSWADVRLATASTPAVQPQVIRPTHRNSFNEPYLTAKPEKPTA